MASFCFSQIVLEEHYVSLTPDSGYLNIKKSSDFEMCDYKVQKIYYGKWILNRDTLIFNFTTSKNIKEKSKETESYTEKLIVSGYRIASLIPNKRAYMSKVQWLNLLSQQKKLRKKKKVWVK